MAKKVMNKQKELADAILSKCKELGCVSPNDCAELIGAATLIILNVTGDYLGVSFDDIRKEYVRGILAAELN